MPWIVFTNVYVALCGAALTAASYALLGLTPRVDAGVGLVFFCTLVIYNLDRLVEPHPGNSPHEQWVDQHRQVLWWIVALSAASASLLATRLSASAQWSLVPAGAVAIGYCIPVVGPRFGSTEQSYRLKDLPGAKLLLIAMVWTYATAGLPMLESGTRLHHDSAMILLARLFFIAAVALPFDLPDMERDKRSGIKTVPLLLGVSMTRYVALLLITLSAACSFWCPWPQDYALLTSCVCVAGLLWVLRPDRGVLYFMVALDGMLLIQAGLLWASVI